MTAATGAGQADASQAGVGKKEADQAGAGQALVDAHRRAWAFVLAATLRVAQDLDLAEECVQEAYAVAATAYRQASLL